jgi:AcrR family transcriptional regulator
MPRPPEPERRDELEQRLVDYVLENGATGFSLRPVSRALGVSTYALTYHFGPRDQVLAAAFAGAQRRQLEMVRRWFDRRPPTPGALLRRYWRWALTDEGRRHHRLFFEVISLAASAEQRLEPGPWHALLRDLLHSTGLKGRRLDDVVTRMTATVTGLSFDLLITGDERRTTRTLNAIAADLDRLSI